MNYFAYPTAARRYAAARPYFHPRVIQKIKTRLEIHKPVRRALDVACGTGQSTRALKEIAKNIVGIDSAQEMLSEALSEANIHYLQASAEALPFPHRWFDLITVSMAFHWFERSSFLAEASRVLKPGKWLVLYNHGYLGQMQENPTFAEWNRNTFLQRFPTTEQVIQHSQHPLTTEELRPFHLNLLERQMYTYSVTLTPEALADYLLTLSSVIATIEKGSAHVDDVYEWLLGHLYPLFKGETGTFEFGGYIEYLQKDS
ncbi:class I SAM-dependent methyltransferase [Tengunoibacter tsumagoiensis]|uniref:Methyltransferase type 11 n=1 Tax=Tengunoibacter tsumagoiensis TaxID=2014871 RepID=A0A401ZU75_9CHLR|nr:class I SAM-dependent methyltransferase [Tengunoibacter tsumagoiensis]GCE10449.1 methyltransferase type 11 [Tengunoibacter tsumagoiensis]